MSQVQKLRGFISERLNAAVEEILATFEKTILKYEEEAAINREVISRQHALLCALNKTMMDTPSANVLTHQLSEDQQDLDQNVVPGPFSVEEKTREEIPIMDEVEIIEFTYNSRRGVKPRDELQLSGEPGPVVPDQDVPHVSSSETEDSEDYSRDAEVSPVLEKLELISRSKEGSSCQACSRNFKHRRILFRHVGAHVHDENQVCGLCGERFGVTGGLKLHLQTHLRKRKLQNHARTESREKRLHQISHPRKSTETEKPKNSDKTQPKKRPVGRPRKQKEDQVKKSKGAKKRKRKI